MIASLEQSLKGKSKSRFRRLKSSGSNLRTVLKKSEYTIIDKDHGAWPHDLFHGLFETK